jgi:hypothetical protein
MSDDIPPRKDICECSVLSDASREPGTAIEFGAKHNEYHIVNPDGGYMMIYYCPFCGGRAPRSQRHTLFAHVTEAEQARLRELFEGLRTIDDVLARFGPPDEDQPVGIMMRHPPAPGQPDRGEAIRTLHYRSISPVAEIVFQVHVDNRVHGSWASKPLSETQ